MQARKHFYTKPQACGGISAHASRPVRQARHAGEEHGRRMATRPAPVNTFKLTVIHIGTCSHAALQTSASRKRCTKRRFRHIRNGILTTSHCRTVLFTTRESPSSPPQTALSAMRKRLSRNARKALPHCRKNGTDIHYARNFLSCNTLRKHVIFTFFRHKTLFIHEKRALARLVFNIPAFMCKISHAMGTRISCE